MTTVNILSTRLLDDEIIARAASNNIRITQWEFISIRPLNDEVTRQLAQESVARPLISVFTSSNAVSALRSLVKPKTLDVCCLGGKTKETVLQSFPGSNILAVANDAAELAHIIVRSDTKELLFYCGDRRREELPSILTDAEVKVHEVVVYQTVETPATVNATYDGMIFFSPSAVDSYFSVNKIADQTVCFAPGETTASKIRKHCDNPVILSNAPGQKDILTAIQNYFLNIQR